VESLVPAPPQEGSTKGACIAAPPGNGHSPPEASKYARSRATSRTKSSTSHSRPKDLPGARRGTPRRNARRPSHFAGSAAVGAHLAARPAVDAPLVMDDQSGRGDKLPGCGTRCSGRGSPSGTRWCGSGPVFRDMRWRWSTLPVPPGPAGGMRTSRRPRFPGLATRPGGFPGDDLVLELASDGVKYACTRSRGPAVPDSRVLLCLPQHVRVQDVDLPARVPRSRSSRAGRPSACPGCSGPEQDGLKGDRVAGTLGSALSQGPVPLTRRPPTPRGPCPPSGIRRGSLRVRPSVRADGRWDRKRPLGRPSGLAASTYPSPTSSSRTSMPGPELPSGRGGAVAPDLLRSTGP